MSCSRRSRGRSLATVRRFVSAEVLPYLAASPKDEFPRPLFARLCAMGLGGIPFPAEYGGGGADYATYALVLEELAVAGGALAGTLSVHGLPQLDPEPVRNRGAEGPVPASPRRGRAPRSVRADGARDGLGRRGDRDARRGRRETGSCSAGARRGSRTATVADLFVVFARTGEKEISAFLVEKGTPGLARPSSGEEARAAPVSDGRALPRGGARAGRGASWAGPGTGSGSRSPRSTRAASRSARSRSGSAGGRSTPRSAT